MSARFLSRELEFSSKSDENTTCTQCGNITAAPVHLFRYWISLSRSRVHAGTWRFEPYVTSNRDDTYVMRL